MVWFDWHYACRGEAGESRELITFAAASVQAAVVLSMLPIILGGSIIEFHIWQIFSYVPMLFGWMDRGFFLHWLPRFFGSPPHFIRLDICGACMNMPKPVLFLFALSLSATMGVAFRQSFDHLFLLRNAFRFHLPSGHSYAG